MAVLTSTCAPCSTATTSAQPAAVTTSPRQRRPCTPMRNDALVSDSSNSAVASSSIRIRVGRSTPRVSRARATGGCRADSDGVAGHRVDVANRLESFEEAAQLRQVLDLDDGADYRGLVVIDL